MGSEHNQFYKGYIYDRFMTDKCKWVVKTIDFIEEGGIRLNFNDRVTIRRCIDLFFDDFRSAQNREPVFDYSTLRVLYYSYLSQFGYKMPIIERWAKEDEARLKRLGINMNY